MYYQDFGTARQADFINFNHSSLIAAPSLNRSVLLIGCTSVQRKTEQDEGKYLSCVLPYISDIFRKRRPSNQGRSGQAYTLIEFRAERTAVAASCVVRRSFRVRLIFYSFLVSKKRASVTFCVCVLRFCYRSVFFGGREVNRSCAVLVCLLVNAALSIASDSSLLSCPLLFRGVFCFLLAKAREDANRQKSEPADAGAQVVRLQVCFKRL